MSITIHCPHDKTELILIPDEKTPDGLLKCQKCNCTFRVCLAIFDHKCFSKIYPTTKWKEGSGKPIKGDAGFTAEDVKQAFKKRGRPKKVEENAK